ncbi:hypothetical protein [Dactylosporangium sp. NPDC048998]|uniref:hypothetical protein n=1 Tax=Dactylosporangium sp. NPDC048998 TaxID=3363976 RepID=UPI00371A485D
MVGLPGTAIIIDDIDTNKPLGPDGCAPVASGGKLTWKFGSASSAAGTIYPSKVDFHQIGAGFGGHFWFAHTQQSFKTSLQVTGTWTPTNRLNGWYQVMVHLPDNGAWTQQAHYVIHTGGGQATDRERFLPTNRSNARNLWMSVGRRTLPTSPIQESSKARAPTRVGKVRPCSP